MIETVIGVIEDLPPVATASEVSLQPFEINESSTVSNKAKKEFSESNPMIKTRLWVVGAAAVATAATAASLYHAPASSFTTAAALSAVAASSVAILTPMATRVLAKRKESDGDLTIGGVALDDTVGSFKRFVGAIREAGDYARASYSYITATPNERLQMKANQSNKAGATMDKYDHMSLGEKAKTIGVDVILIGLSTAAIYGSSMVVDPALEHVVEALKNLVERNPNGGLGAIMGVAAANNIRELLSITASEMVNITTKKTNIRMNPVEMMACGTVGLMSKAVDGYRKVREVVGDAYFNGALIASDLSVAAVERVQDAIHHLTQPKIEREYTSPIDRILRSKMGMSDPVASSAGSNDEPISRKTNHMMN